MDKNQMLVLALANVPPILTVLIGILLNNGRLGDLQNSFRGLESRLTGLEGRLASMQNSLDNRLTNLEHKLDTRFDMLLTKVVEVYNRLTRIEAQRS
jgi:hypothetical protein